MAKVYKTKKQTKRDKRDQEIIELFKSKTGAMAPILDDIAEEYDISKWTVRYILKKNKLIPAV